MSVIQLLKGKAKTVYSIKPKAPLCDCLKLLNDKRIGALLVIGRQGKLEGLISERDVLRTAHKTKGKMCHIPVEKIMTPRKKLVTAGKENSIHEVMETMTKRRVRHLPILDGEKIIGIISIGDVVKALLDEVLAENKQMQDYIYGKYI
ncbi:MAG: CBS domain-containing protein [Kiritimatiellae bacterium]|nr:CBS domain-containing protein [Kiritimatiellia bacterium]MDD5519988.1 CBS domain-containing protein [Kiritimatiellia bacterium]